MKMIHDGSARILIPAVTKIVTITDPEAENYGEMVEQEVEPAREDPPITLPPGTKIGAYLIGRVVEIPEKDVELYTARGFKSAAAGKEAFDPIQKIAERDRKIADAKPGGSFVPVPQAEVGLLGQGRNSEPRGITVKRAVPTPSVTPKPEGEV